MSNPKVSIGGNYSKLSPEQCEKIHAASLEILERTGVRLYEPEALELVKAAGANITDGNRVRLSPSLVEKAIDTTPKSFQLFDQVGNPAFEITGRCHYYTNGCDCLYVIDHRTDQRRLAVLNDVREAITLCDALENIDYLMSMFLPSDVNGEIADRFQMEAMLTYSNKPICFVTHSFEGWVDVIKMAELVAGGAEQLAAKPFVACYALSTTALRHNQDSLERLLYSVGKGLPTLYFGGTTAGLTSPITVAGALALRNAGSLVGLVLSQLKREGAPMIIAGGMGGSLDMRTMILPYCEPQPLGALESMAHFYGIPMFSTAGASNSKLVDQQAAIDAALTMLVDALAGGQLVHNLGYLESAMAASLVQLAICDEIVDWIRNLTRPIEINKETLALDLIDEIGPDGEFLYSAHTARNYRKRWYPRLIERGNYEQWVEKGSKSLGQRTAEYVEKTLQTHQPEPLPADVSAAIHAVVEQAAAQPGR